MQRLRFKTLRIYLISNTDRTFDRQSLVLCTQRIFSTAPQGGMRLGALPSARTSYYERKNILR